MFFPKEIPTGTIDSVNTIFNTANQIYQVDDLWVDGAIYTDFTFSGTTLTLTDAPTADIFVDYYNTASGIDSDGCTVQQAVNILERHYDRAIGEVSDELYYDWLNDLNYMVYSMLSNVDLAKYISNTNYALVDGTSSYSLPSDFKHIKTSGIGGDKGCGLYYTNDGTATDRLLERTGFGSLRSGYYLEGSNIVITPTPSQSSTITLRYMPLLNRLEALTDQMLISREDITAVMNWLDKSYGQWNLDVFKENSGDQRFANGLLRLIGNATRESLIFTL